LKVRRKREGAREVKVAVVCLEYEEGLEGDSLDAP